MDKYLIGIDLGGTYIKAHIFKDDATHTGFVEFKTPSGDSETVIEKIIYSAEQLVEKYTDSKDFSEISGMGIGVPGTIDKTGKKIVFAPNLKWNNVDIVETLEKILPFPVYIENDANAAALGEHFAGSAKNSDNFINITIGTGIGGGIFQNGHLITGNNHNAAEIGHMIIQIDGLKCGCGNHGCYEKYASTTSLVTRVKDYLKISPPENIDSPGFEIMNSVNNNIDLIEGKQIIEAADKGDKLAKLQLDKMIYYLAIGISNLIFIFNPEKIILSGGITGRGSKFLNPLIDEINKMAPPASLENFQIEIGKLGNMAGAYGAASLALKKDIHE